MINLGMDFGSTYTMVGIFDEAFNRVKTLSLNEGGSDNFRSLVVKQKEQYYIGEGAKSYVGKKNANTFTVFKMLLTESNEENLMARGFSKEDSPEKITKIFLKEILEAILEREKETTIDHLVIGVPEIWFERFERIDGREIIRQICGDFNFVNDVQLVSEPAAATAFCAYNFEKITGKHFEGSLLLIDYGGGTLDITLSQVLPNVKGKDNCVEIKVLEQNGAGENTDHEIGNAGTVFKESVIIEALRRAEILTSEEEPERNGKFYKLVYELENDLKNRGKQIKGMFDEYGIDEEDELEEEEFTTLEYKDEDIEISYGLLVKVYNQVIRPILDEKLEQMIAFLNKHNIPYRDRNQNKFKIALVGGFCNFYLVRRQVEDKFKMNDKDKRCEYIIEKKEDGEKAIALGAALLAEEKIGIRNTAPYSIAIDMENAKGQRQYHYAFRYNQDIEFDKVYFPISAVDNEPIRIMASDKAISKFIINRGYDDKTAVPITVKAEIRPQLANLITNQYRTAVIGFSLDSSEVLTLHIRDYDLLERKISDVDHRIKLRRLSELFDVVML